MQTFLPYNDFLQSVKVLDYKRLGKQRVEAWQILQALLGNTRGWVNHPATRLWRDHEKLLCEYGIAICDEWIRRGFKDTMRERFIAIHPTLSDCDLPDWFGVEEFHDSHKSNLKRKDPIHYDFNVVDSLPYLWFKGVIGFHNNKTQRSKLLLFKLGNANKSILVVKNAN